MAVADLAILQRKQRQSESCKRFSNLWLLVSLIVSTTQRCKRQRYKGTVCTSVLEIVIGRTVDKVASK
jgi:hypothetical protein